MRWGKNGKKKKSLSNAMTMDTWCGQNNSSQSKRGGNYECEGIKRSEHRCRHLKNHKRDSGGTTIWMQQTIAPT